MIELSLRNSYCFGQSTEGQRFSQGISCACPKPLSSPLGAIVDVDRIPLSSLKERQGSPIGSLHYVKP